MRNLPMITGVVTLVCVAAVLALQVIDLVVLGGI